MKNCLPSYNGTKNTGIAKRKVSQKSGEMEEVWTLIEVNIEHISTVETPNPEQTYSVCPWATEDAVNKHIKNDF